MASYSGKKTSNIASRTGVSGIRPPSVSGIRPPSISGSSLKPRSRSQSRSLNPPNSTGPRSSRARSSSIGRASSRSSFASRLSDGGRPKKDTRPLSSKEYQHDCMQKLSMFLHKNKFERYQPITSRLLSSPSTKDFHQMFEFLYGLLAPNYSPQSNINEILDIMKYLRYPYNISRSHLLNPGSRQSWSHLLPFLTWMVDLIGYCQLYEIPIRKDQFEDYRSSSSDGDSVNGTLNYTLLELFHQQSGMMFRNYVNENQDCSEEKKFEEIHFLVKEYMGISEEELEFLRNEHSKYAEDLKKAKQEMNLVKDNEQKIDNIKVDINVFESYNDDMARRIELKKEELSQINAQTDIIRARLQAAKDKNAKLKQTLKDQNARGINAQVLVATKKHLYDELASWEQQLESVINKKVDWELNQLEIHNEFLQHCKSLEELRLKLADLVDENLDLYNEFHEKASLDKFLNFTKLLEKVSTKDVEYMQRDLPDLLSSLKNYFSQNGSLIENAIFQENDMITQLEIQSNILNMNIRDIICSIEYAKKQQENDKKDLEQRVEKLLNDIKKMRDNILEADKGDVELMQLEENVKMLKDRLSEKKEKFEIFEMQHIELSKKNLQELKNLTKVFQQEKKDLIHGLELLKLNMEKVIDKY